jgi:hypothetical protein
MPPLYSCNRCGCEVGGLMAALVAVTDGCPLCGSQDDVTRSLASLEAEAPPPQPRPVCPETVGDDTIPF